MALVQSSFLDKIIVRCFYDRENTWWFVASDVATCLGYQNISKSLYDHVSKEHKITFLQLLDRYQDDKDVSNCLRDLNLQSHQNLINELGVLKFIFSSKLPIAEYFQDWLWSTLLPKLRDNCNRYKIAEYNKRLAEQALQFQQERNDIIAEYDKQLEQKNCEITEHELKNEFLMDTIDELTINCVKNPSNTNLRNSFAIFNLHDEHKEYQYYAIRGQLQFLHFRCIALQTIYPRLRRVVHYEYVPNAITFFNKFKEYIIQNGGSVKGNCFNLPDSMSEEQLVSTIDYFMTN